MVIGGRKCRIRINVAYHRSQFAGRIPCLDNPLHRVAYLGAQIRQQADHELQQSKWIDRLIEWEEVTNKQTDLGNLERVSLGSPLHVECGHQAVLLPVEQVEKICVHLEWTVVVISELHDRLPSIDVLDDQRQMDDPELDERTRLLQIPASFFGQSVHLNQTLLHLSRNSLTN